MKVEARTAILSSLFLTSSVYVSGFSPVFSLAVFAISISVNPEVKILKKLSPFLLYFFLSSLLLSGIYAIKATLALLSILTAGLIVSTVNSAEFSKALNYFGVPESWAFQVSLALRMFKILENDVARCFEASKLEYSGIRVYLNTLKAFSAVAVLRSVALAEALYCKGYAGKIPGELRKPGKKDLALLTISIILFIFSIFKFLF